MAVITSGELLDRLEERLRNSDGVDIAVAWATHCPAVERLRAFSDRGGKLRIVVGIDRSVTDPTTLLDLQGFARLRVGAARPPAVGLFHPKYYCFRNSTSSTVWVGSANLTGGGFGGNEELVLECAGDAESRAWFDALWSSCPANPNRVIEDYARNWHPQPEGERRGTLSARSRKSPPTVAEQLDPSWSWDDFVANLWVRNEAMLVAAKEDGSSKPEEPWSVFGEYRSWMHTVRVGRSVVRLQSWRNLKPWQAEVLVGQSPWGALGTLKGAGKASSMVRGNADGDAEVRTAILRHLRSTDVAEADAVRIGVQALAGIRDSGPRIGPGVATRLLTLARPDRYVSLNGASRRALAEYSGLWPTTLDRRYGDLLAWVYGSKWYQAARPTDVLEGEIWDYRAALVDAFVYEG